jgi:hypothetical protein
MLQSSKRILPQKMPLWWVWMQEFDVDLPVKSWEVYFQPSMILFRSSNLTKRTLPVQKPPNELVSIWCSLV